jgi:hypothetical protein
MKIGRAISDVWRFSDVIARYLPLTPPANNLPHLEETVSGAPGLNLLDER